MAGVTNYPVILAQLVSLVTAATGAKNVYGYQRHVGDWNAMLTLFKASTVTGVAPNQVTTYNVHGWTVSRSSVAETWLTNREVVRDHTFTIRGWYGVQDSANTEDTFNDVIESVSDHLREDFTVSGTAEWHEPIQWSTVDYRSFSGIFCHYAEGTVKVRERLLGGV